MANTSTQDMFPSSLSTMLWPNAYQLQATSNLELSQHRVPPSVMEITSPYSLTTAERLATRKPIAEPPEVEDHHRYGVVHPEQSEEYVIPSGYLACASTTRTITRESEAKNREATDRSCGIQGRCIPSSGGLSRHASGVHMYRSEE